MFRLTVLMALSLGVAAQPVLAQSTQQQADKLGKKGIYGTSSVGEEDGAAPGQPAAPISEEAARLKAKYPLSTTAKTSANQNAHTFLLKGIQQYHLTRDIFNAANEITGTFEPSNHVFRMEQKGVIMARLQPQDLLLYGPEYAHFAVRMRALQDADRTIGQAIGNFSQAQALAPSLSVLPKWLRVARDTQKAIRFHIRFYQTSLKAVQRGATSQQLEQMAMMWNAPRVLNPQDTLMTRVQTYVFEKARGTLDQEESGGEKIQLDTYKDKLPTLDFEIKKL
ncbi:MAG: hypothetical protein ACO1RX_21060 [Candidatus Sericytochromatia bacterium]